MYFPRVIAAKNYKIDMKVVLTNLIANALVITRSLKSFTILTFRTDQKSSSQLLESSCLMHQRYYIYILSVSPYKSLQVRNVGVIRFSECKIGRKMHCNVTAITGRTQEYIIDTSIVYICTWMYLCLIRRGILRS